MRFFQQYKTLPGIFQRQLLGHVIACVCLTILTGVFVWLRFEASPCFSPVSSVLHFFCSTVFGCSDWPQPNDILSLRGLALLFIGPPSVKESDIFSWMCRACVCRSRQNVPIPPIILNSHCGCIWLFKHRFTKKTASKSFRIIWASKRFPVLPIIDDCNFSMLY